MTDTSHRLKTLLGDPSYWFLLLVLAVIAVYSSSISSMFSVWWQAGSAYSHGLLLSVIAIYIFAKNWHSDKASLSPGFHPLGFLFLLICVPLWVASHLMFIQSAEQFFFLAILFFLFPAVLGFKPSLKYFFPVILLLVAIPVWGVGVSVLQFLTTVVSAFFLKLSGITSVRDGFFILVPAGTFEVEAACSGLRYQLAGVSISLLYVYLARMKILAGLFFLFCSVVVVFLANVTRIYIVVLAGEMTQMKSSLVEDHLWLGWLIFAIYITLFLWAAEKILPVKYNDEKKSRAEEPNLPARTVTYRQAISLLLIFLVCLSGPILAGYYSLERYRDKHVVVDLPSHANGWNEVPELTGFSPLRSSYHRANGELSRIYKNARNVPVSYQMYYYLFQEQGREAINELNQAYDSKYWKVQRSGDHEIPGGLQGQTAVVKESIIGDMAGKKRLVWLWYQTNGQMLANEKKAKLENLLANMQGNPSISVNIVSTDILQNEEHARQVLLRFIDTVVTSLTVSEQVVISR